MEAVRAKLSKHTKAIYVLSRDDGEYTITVIEQSTLDGKTSVFSAPKITPDKKRARRIFKKICKGKVFGETLLDVVYNLME